MVAKHKEAGQILTVTPRGLFIDGKPTKTYNGANIKKADDFAKLLGKDFDTVQIMQSETEGKYMMPGNPTPDADGLYTWVRARPAKKGTFSDWMMLADYEGFPRVTSDMFQSTVKDVIRRIQEGIVSEAMVLQSKKRPEFRQAIFDDIKGWKSESELVQYLDTGALGADSEEKSTELLHKKLKSFATQKPDAVRFAEDTGVYSLKMTNIVLFSRLSKTRLIYPVKKDNWLTAEELSKHYIKAKPDVISAKMNDLYVDMSNGLSDDFEPDDFDETSAEIINGGFDQVAVGNIEQWTNQKTGEPELCLKDSAIKEFCKKSGLTPKPDPNEAKAKQKATKKPTASKKSESVKTTALKKGKKNAEASLKQSRMKELLGIFRHTSDEDEI